MKSDREKRCWESIDHRYMTDESEGEGDSIVRHPLPWLSYGKFNTH